MISTVVSTVVSIRLITLIFVFSVTGTPPLYLIALTANLYGRTCYSSSASYSQSITTVFDLSVLLSTIFDPVPLVCLGTYLPAFGYASLESHQPVSRAGPPLGVSLSPSPGHCDPASPQCRFRCTVDRSSLAGVMAAVSLSLSADGT